jgi:hypothetical protein
METLIINIPEKKSTLVKKMLRDMGVTIQQTTKLNLKTYKEKIADVSTWTDNDLKVFDETKGAFENLKPQQW